MQAKLLEWQDAVPATEYSHAIQQRDAFKRHKVDEKRKWIEEKLELRTLLGKIATKLKTYQMRPYAPPVELSSAVSAKNR